MIGTLPKQLNINGISRAIRSDYRVALLIFQAYNDPELSDQEKTAAMLGCLYKDFEEILPEDYQGAITQAVWFLDGGSDKPEHQQPKKIMDWEQDEQLIFSAVNKVAGCETRSKRYIHWWTFLDYFNEIGEGLFSSVINIRQKMNKGKKLENYEQEFYQENQSLIELDTKLTAEEQAEYNYWNEITK